MTGAGTASSLASAPYRRWLGLSAKLGLCLALAAGMALFVLTGTVQAGAAAGPGGRGAGGGGLGDPMTRYGHGWVSYDVNGGGPRNGFRDTQTWSSVQNACRGLGATEVYAYIINNLSQNGMIYDFPAGNERFRMRFDMPIRDGGMGLATGAPVDPLPGPGRPYSRARVITMDQASTAWHMLVHHYRLVDPNVHRFGDNVGWFCYNFARVNAECHIYRAPREVRTGETFTATIRVRNTGTTVWSVHPDVNHRFRLGSQEDQDNGRWGTGRLEIAGTELTGLGWVVRPYNPQGNPTHESMTTASFTAPTVPGLYAFAWRVIQDRLPDGNVGAWHGNICRAEINVVPPAPATGAACEITSFPSRVTVGQTFEATFRIHNTGGTVWNVDPRNPNRFKLGSQEDQDNGRWGTGRLEIAAPGTYNPVYGGWHVPGGHVTTTWPSPATFRAPNTPGQHVFAWRVLQENVSWHGNICRTEINVDPPPVVLNCGPVTFIPTSPQPGQPFTIRPSFTVSGWHFDNPNADIRITRVDRGLTISPPLTRDYEPPRIEAGGSGSAVFDARADAPGAYEFRFTLTGTGLDCAGRVIIMAQPYLRVYGGDVSVGSGFLSGDTCQVNPNAQIRAHNRSGAHDFAGSGAQLAVFAINHIEGFASGMMNATSGKRLTFANVGGLAGDRLFGGFLDGSQFACIPDYWSQRPAAANVPGATFNPVAASSGDYFRDGNVTISVHGRPHMERGQRVRLFVNGNAFINGDIIYAHGAYTNIAQIPNFTLVVTGNIYISPSVNTLMGNYIAQGPTGGAIYTCANGFGSMPTADQLAARPGSGCAQQLTIWGSFIANNVKFQRSFGSLDPRSSPNEWHDRAGSAETFIYTAENWLVPHGAATGIRRDSVISLPPVL